MKKLVLIINLFIFFSPVRTLGQIDVDPGHTIPLKYDNIIESVFLGNGVGIIDIKFTGDPKAVGVFSNASDVIGIDRGIIMTTGHASDASKKTEEIANEDTTQDTLNDTDLENLLVNNIDLIDIAKYEITFIPTSDTLRFRYVFASEEYPEFVCSSTNDVFGFFINGPNPEGGNYNFKNIALIPDPADTEMNTFLNYPVSVNYVNSGSPGPQNQADPYCEDPLGSLDFSTYYNETPAGSTPIYNAFLDVFVAEAAVIPCEIYTIKMAIADGRLGDFDSAVFLEEKSFSTGSLLVNIINPGVDGGISESCQAGILQVSLPHPVSSDFPIQIRALDDPDLESIALEGEDFEMILTAFIPKGFNSTNIEIIGIDDQVDEETEYIYLEIQTDICNTDTISIPISENRLKLISVQDSLFTCTNQAQDVVIEIDDLISITEEQTFFNSVSVMSNENDSIIQSTILVNGISNPYLEKNMIAEICIDTLIHQRLNDLDIYLQAPDENILELSTDNGNRPSNDNQPDSLINTCFTVFSGTNINLGNPIEGSLDMSNPTYSGQYLPEGSMENWLFPLRSKSNGNYTLIVIDDQKDEHHIELTQ